ncbi:MAG: transposase [Chloroflexi bacterium]|nr:transposase [Chloroflexota bacterium]
MRDVNHKLSRQIVNLAVEQGAAIALEELTAIRERVRATRSVLWTRRVNRMIHSWTFRQLREMIDYKATAAGVAVVVVDPRGTSRTCPQCRHVAKANRVTQALFRCQRCGYESNADRVAAINIARQGQHLLEEASSASGVA